MGDMARKIYEAPPYKKLCDAEGNLDDEYDWINLLPEEILVGILSKLKLKEAASTSILAQKWRSLWIFTTGSLDFDDEKTMAEFRSQPLAKSITVERIKFISWVNKVLYLHKGSSIEELKICFDLNKSSTSEVDSWIFFAIEKSVQRLELDFSNCLHSYHVQPYEFPSVKKMNNFFSSNTSARHLDLNSNLSFCCLRSLHLKHVNLTDELLSYVLDHFSFLERLCVANSLPLRNAKISSPNLKYLEICNCFNLIFMEVSAINLVSLKYIGAKMRITFKDAPCLSELYTGGDFTECLIFEVPYILNNLLQLKTLKLCFFKQMTKRYPYYPYFQLNYLKHLEVILWPSCEFSLLRYTCLLVGFPSLTTFKIRLATREPWKEFQPWFEIAFLEQIASGFAIKPHPSLKVLELVNFMAYPSEFDLARRLIQITPSLKKIIVLLKEGIENLNNAINLVGSLRALLPPEAELVILPVVPEGGQLI